VAAGALLVGVLLEVQVMGSALPPRHVWRAGVLFLLVASLVYSVARYYDERSSTFEENLRAPWHARRDAARARGSRIDFFGFLLALLALVLG
jgi:high-affinity Fe2+/Pb2+ permease